MDANSVIFSFHPFTANLDNWSIWCCAGNYDSHADEDGNWARVHSCWHGFKPVVLLQRRGTKGDLEAQTEHVCLGRHWKNNKHKKSIEKFKVSSSLWFGNFNKFEFAVYRRLYRGLGQAFQPKEVSGCFWKYIFHVYEPCPLKRFHGVAWSWSCLFCLSRDCNPRRSMQEHIFCIHWSCLHVHL